MATAPPPAQAAAFQPAQGQESNALDAHHHSTRHCYRAFDLYLDKVRNLSGIYWLSPLFIYRDMGKERMRDLTLIRRGAVIDSAPRRRNELTMWVQPAGDWGAR